MNGEIKLILSKKDLNAFSFKIPIQIKPRMPSEKHQMNFYMSVFNESNRTISKAISNYLLQFKIDLPINTKIIKNNEIAM